MASEGQRSFHFTMDIKHHTVTYLVTDGSVP